MEIGMPAPRSCGAQGDELSAVCQQSEPAAGLEDGDACQEVMAQGQERSLRQNSVNAEGPQ